MAKAWNKRFLTISIMGETIVLYTVNINGEKLEVFSITILFCIAKQNAQDKKNIFWNGSIRSKY